MAIAKLSDVEIYYETQGSGEPVLLAPASWWPAATWNVGVVPILSRRFRTIVFDCRGTGRSSQPTQGYSVAQFAADCLGLLAYLGISRCHVVGFALGGQIMQALAIERPDMVATLTIARFRRWDQDSGWWPAQSVAGYGTGNSRHRLRALHSQLYRERHDGVQSAILSPEPACCRRVS